MYKHALKVDHGNFLTVETLAVLCSFNSFKLPYSRGQMILWPTYPYQMPLGKPLLFMDESLFSISLRNVTKQKIDCQLGGPFVPRLIRKYE